MKPQKHLEEREFVELFLGAYKKSGGELPDSEDGMTIFFQSVAFQLALDIAMKKGIKIPVDDLVQQLIIIKASEGNDKESFDEEVFAIAILERLRTLEVLEYKPDDISVNKEPSLKGIQDRFTAIRRALRKIERVTGTKSLDEEPNNTQRKKEQIISIDATTPEKQSQLTFDLFQKVHKNVDIPGRVTFIQDLSRELALLCNFSEPAIREAIINTLASLEKENTHQEAYGIFRRNPRGFYPLFMEELLKMEKKH